MASDGFLARLKQLFKRDAGGGSPVTTPPPGTSGDRETSTNAQTEGAVGQPWSGEHDA